MNARPDSREDLLVSGHRACPGCAMAIAVRHVLRATGSNVIVVTPTGCLETFTSPYAFSPWRVPWIHHLFENGPAIASGIAAAMKARQLDTRVIVIGGDGGTFDIGLGALSGMLERGDDVLYVCVDNEAYVNTGGQRSGASPLYASTTTCPAGKWSIGKPQRKKDLPMIVAAHGAPYVATASISNLLELQRKVRRAMEYHGPRYIQIDTPCTSLWGFPPERTIEVARLGVDCGLVPIFDMEGGKLARVRKIKKQAPVTDYLMVQDRFNHLFRTEQEGAIAEIQALADRNIATYGLMEGKA